MALPRPSPFANEPFDVAAAGTESLVEEWLKARKVSEASEVFLLLSYFLLQVTDCVYSPQSRNQSGGTTAASVASPSRHSSSVYGRHLVKDFALTATVFLVGFTSLYSA